jgi:antitoxin component YwqK of YwqJK toxin-antitoxin module
MTILLRAVFILFLFSGCSGHSRKVEIDPNTGFRTEYTTDTKSKLHDGPYIKRDSSGVLLEKGTLKQGVQEGIRELYFPDGKVNIRERYANGTMDDLYEFFHPNGVLQLKGYYIKGEMYGLWRKYSPEGKLMEKVLMIANEENGPFTEYYPDGKIAAEGAYLHGPNESGTLKLYNESGELYKTMQCYDGRCYTTWLKG